MKKPPPKADFRLLSCTLTPSSVMLSVPLGSPLTVEVRGEPGVLVPGSSNTRSSASREDCGRSVIWRPVIVVPTVAD